MIINIQGHFISKFGELWEKGIDDLIQESIMGALQSASLEAKDIEAVFVSSKASGAYNQQRHLNALVSSHFAHHPPAMRIEGACASGALAVVAAELALLSGVYKTVLVLGVEKMTDVDAASSTKILATAASTEEEFGSTFPGLYALLTNLYENRFKLTRDELSSVAVKNHHHALDNPKAQFRKEISLKAVSNSNLVADPLRLLDCSPLSDGSASLILTSKKIKNKTKIMAFGHAQDSLDLAHRKDLLTLQATVQAAKRVYLQSGLKPQDIEAAEVHDCFTIAEILAIEDLGFFTKGQGAKASLAGQTTYGGKVVINPSGGLKACGHPIGATGIKQIAYLAKLLEEKRFKHVLTHNVGGSGATAVVHLLGI